MRHADLDRDGFVDLAVPSTREDAVTVLFGAGDGTFVAGATLETPEPRDVQFADVNGDGFEDVLTASGHVISVFLGNGTRSFAQAIDSWIGMVTFTLGVADFNEDGHLDAIVTFLGGGADVLPGQGDGSFMSPEHISSIGSYVVVGDFDRDGHADFVGSRGDALVLFAGGGDGTFVAGDPMTVGSGPQELIARDFNADGWLDLAVANLYSDDLSVLLNDAQGTFHAETRYSALDGTRLVTSGDLNSDGYDDLIASSLVETEVAVLLSHGDGTFQSEQRYATLFTGGGVTAADFDRNGNVDVALASFGRSVGSKSQRTDPTPVSILAGDGTGVLEAGAVPHTGVGASPEALVAADFDGDGVPDVATANAESSDVTVLRGHGDGSLEVIQEAGVGSEPFSIAAGNVDGGAKGAATIDLVTADVGSGELSVLLGLGDGTFQPRIAVTVGRLPASVVLADFDEDGDLDAATANPATGDVTVLTGSGDGSFVPVAHLVVGEQPSRLVVRDVNGDGRPDLVVANTASMDVSVLLNAGGGAFQAESRYPVGLGPDAIAVGDLNADGRPDAVLGGRAFSLSVLFGDGAGGFSTPLMVPVRDWVHDVAIADFDGNGRADIAVGPLFGSFVTVLSGEPDGSFTTGHFALSGARVTIGVADLNHDGLLDVVGASDVADRVSTLVNQTSSDLVFGPDSATLTWPILLGVQSFNVYRGDLSHLRDTDGEGLPVAGYGDCRTDLDPDPTDQRFIDPEIPLPGDGFFYLRSRIVDQAEVDLGTTSAGQPRFVAVPCDAP